MSNTPKDNGAYELDTPTSVQHQDSYNEKTKKRSMNPAKAVTRGFTQGTQAVVGGVTQGTKAVRGGLSQGKNDLQTPYCWPRIATSVFVVCKDGPESHL